MTHDPSHCPKFQVDCINRKILDQISGKWSIMVLTMLGFGPHRFNAIKKQLEGISQKALTDTLRKLEQILRQKEKLADGLHLIDFEQLKIENQTLNGPPRWPAALLNTHAYAHARI